MNSEKSIRTFLAVDLPVEIRNEIARIQDRLKMTIQGRISWVRPEGIHLTLKFFGNVSESDIANISPVVENNAAKVKPFALNVKKLGVFPDVKRPRVIWLGMDGDVDTLIHLQRNIDLDLHNFGFKKEERPFRPHLTLSRIKEPKGLIGLAKIIEKGEDYTAGHFPISGLTLFKSDLTPKGAIYTKLGYFPFAG